MRAMTEAKQAPIPTVRMLHTNGRWALRFGRWRCAGRSGHAPFARLALADDDAHLLQALTCGPVSVSHVYHLHY